MIELKGISKIYEMKKTDDVKALDNVSITFPSKGMVFVLGKSGSGKSTLLNVAGGLDQYTSGDLIIKGKSTKNFKQSDFDSYRNTMIGFIFQEYNILEEFTVAQNIGLALELQGKKATSEEISAILEQVDLAGYGTRKPNELSGGQRQRVAIARALVKQPEVIMADEPTGALDSTTSKQVFETLKKLSETRLVLIVSHDRDYAESYGDRIVEFSDGVIISDTTKNENPDVEKHLTFEDNKLNIKSGYELTEEDIRIINEYLQTEKEALFIDKLGRASFDKTDLSTIVTDPNSQYVPIKSKLPFRSSLKIGASALKHRKVRLVIAILLSSISFALFGLADTMGAYNKVNVTTHSMVDSNVNYISLKKERHVKQGNWTRVDTLKLTLDDVAEFNALDSSLHFIPIYKQYEWDRYSFGNSLDKNVPNEAQYYYHPYFYGYAEVDTATLTKFGYTMSVGRLPQADDEAAIPLEAFELFKLLGYKDLSFNVIRINNPSDMLNKIINVDGKQFKVVGVVDTKFDKSRYDTLKEVDFSAGSFKYYFISNELSTVLRTSLHHALFVNEGYASTAMAFDGVILRDNYINMSFEYNGNTSYVETLKNIDDLEPDDYVLLDGVTPSIINNGGVFISSRMFSDVYYFDDWEDTLHYHVEQAVQAFVNAEVTANRITLEQIKQALQLAGYSDEFLQNDVGDWEEWEKHNAINYFTYEFYNEYAPRHNYPGSYNEIKRDVEAAFFTSIPTFDIDLETTTYRYDYVSKTDRVQVLGIIKVNEGTSYEDYYKIAVNEETYDSLIEVEDGVYLNIVSPFLNKDAKLIEKFVKKHYSEDEIVYILQNEVTATLSEVNSLFETLGKVFLYIGIGFAVFSAIMLLNFITVSVSYKKKEIGILRAIGARGSDVRGIFTKESTIISLINFVIAFALTLGTVITLNSLLRNEYSLSITLLNFGVRQIGLMLGISLFIGYISSAIPVVKVSRRRPIEAIKDL